MLSVGSLGEIPPHLYFTCVFMGCGPLEQHLLLCVLLCVNPWTLEDHEFEASIES